MQIQIQIQIQVHTQIHTLNLDVWTKIYGVDISQIPSLAAQQIPSLAAQQIPYQNLPGCYYYTNGATTITYSFLCIDKGLFYLLQLTLCHPYFSSVRRSVPFRRSTFTILETSCTNVPWSILTESWGSHASWTNKTTATAYMPEAVAVVLGDRIDISRLESVADGTKQFFYSVA